MSKKQKICMWIYIGLFIIPEILWSPVLSLAHNLFQNTNNATLLRPNFLMTPDRINLILFVILIQIVGLIGFLSSLKKATMNFILKSFLFLVAFFVLIVTGIVFYIAFSLRNGIGF